MSPEEKCALIASIAQDNALSLEEKNAKIIEITTNSAQKNENTTQPEQTNDAGDMSAQEKLRLITSNLQEILNPEIMEDILAKGERPLTIYWGTATTGRPHCGYFVAMLKIAEFLQAGCRVKILLADIHGFLDNLKAPIDLVKHRAEYYKFVIINLLKAVGVSIDRLEFVLGSSYQLTAAYQMDLLRLCTIVTMHDARKAGAEVVKQVENATLSGLIYPLMQAMDEEYLGVDVQFGGVDQRKIFTLAKDVLPKIGYKERAHLMNPMVPGLAGGKMSASDPNSKIDVLEGPESVKKKLKGAHAAPKETEGNGILSFVQYVLLPAGALKNGQPLFTVDRERDGKEPLVYDNIDKMLEDYREDILTPQLLKQSVTKALNELLAPVLEAYRNDKEWQETEAKAYPPPPPEPKKQKKLKNKGTGAPQKDITAQPDGSVEGTDRGEASLGKGAADAIEQLSLAQKAVQE